MSAGAVHTHKRQQYTYCPLTSVIVADQLGAVEECTAGYELHECGQLQGAREIEGRQVWTKEESMSCMNVANCKGPERGSRGGI